jgi:hypothetical protein
MKWLEVLIYTLWLVIAWKVFWKVNGDETKKEKIIKFYVFTLITTLLLAIFIGLFLEK